MQIQAAAVTVAAIRDSAAPAFRLGRFIAQIKAEAEFFINTLPNGADPVFFSAGELGTGVQPALRGDGKLPAPQFTAFAAIVFAMDMAGDLYLREQIR